MPDKVIRADVLEKLVFDITCRLGSNAQISAQVARGLVLANLAGHDSHGVIRLAAYAKQIESGVIVPAAQPEIIKTRTRGAMAVIDAHQGWGQPAAHLATQTAIDLARKLGVAAVTVDHCNHIGRLGEYVDLIARAGLIGVLTCNANANVTAFGGRTRVFGTNPIAIGSPRAQGLPPVVLDMATSAIAEGKLRVARDKGEDVAPGLILDKDGAPSIDPNVFYLGGMLLPVGGAYGHKGSGLAFMVEILGGILSGKSAACLPEYGLNNGVLLIALDPEFFLPREDFIDQVERYCQTVSNSATIAGVSKVLLPGEPELISAEQRGRDGITLPAATWRDLSALAAAHGMTP